MATSQKIHREFYFYDTVSFGFSFDKNFLFVFLSQCFKTVKMFQKSKEVVSSNASTHFLIKKKEALRSVCPCTERYGEAVRRIKRWIKKLFIEQ
ncbi:hypothetical protein [Legionella steelei]|uniref:hypothetical protein n=1 Tax=Legionella steelei TaxID=947033 RepID=UPI00073050A1|nr:hypothetical protein [Legionella steelei]